MSKEKRDNEGHTFKIGEIEVLKKLLVADFVILLNFSGQIRLIMSDSNRYFMHWGHIDDLILITVIFCIALIVVALNLFIQVLELNKIKKIFNHLFLVFLASGIFVVLKIPKGGHSELAWMGVLGVVGYSYACKSSRLIKIAKSACLFLSPLLAILFFQIVIQKNWSGGQESQPEYPQSKKEANPVFFFVFDEWSFTRSFNEDGLLPLFKNLSKLSAQSFVFDNCYSSDSTTEKSVPAIIYQTDYEYQIDEGKAFFQFFALIEKRSRRDHRKFSVHAWVSFVVSTI